MLNLTIQRSLCSAQERQNVDLSCLKQSWIASAEKNSCREICSNLESMVLPQDWATSWSEFHAGMSIFQTLQFEQASANAI